MIEAPQLIFFDMRENSSYATQYPHYKAFLTGANKYNYDA
jgi:hypothetical protein